MGEGHHPAKVAWRWAKCCVPGRVDYPSRPAKKSALQVDAMLPGGNEDWPRLRDTLWPGAEGQGEPTQVHGQEWQMLANTNSEAS